MTSETLRAALDRLRVRVPATAEDAAALRAEVRAADAALGEMLAAAVDRRRAQIAARGEADE